MFGGAALAQPLPQAYPFGFLLFVGHHRHTLGEKAGKLIVQGQAVLQRGSARRLCRFPGGGGIRGGRMPGGLLRRAGRGRAEHIPQPDLAGGFLHRLLTGRDRLFRRTGLGFRRIYRPGLGRFRLRSCLGLGRGLGLRRRFYRLLPGLGGLLRRTGRRHRVALQPQTGQNIIHRGIAGPGVGGVFHPQPFQDLFYRIIGSFTGHDRFLLSARRYQF